MKLIEQTGDSAQVVLTLDEVTILNQALNEVANGIHIPDWEFQTRLGYNRAAVRTLLDAVNHLLEQMEPKSG